MVKLKLSNEICYYTHHKIVFWKKPKTILPLPTVRQASKVLGAFCPGKVLPACRTGRGIFQSGDNCNQDLFFEKTKNQIGFSIIAPGSLESPSKYIIKYLTSCSKSGILLNVKSAYPPASLLGGKFKVS